MKTKSFVILVLAAIVVALSGANCAKMQKPNFVIIFLDDSGYADFHPFSDPAYKTPNVAQLAQEGTRYTQFYVPQAICSASRSALLSGCYPGRTKVFGAHGPHAHGLDPSFATLGEVMKKAGYATAVFGKWHIGDQPETRPPARGFDESCGLMYSNDMWEFHPGNPKKWGRFPLQFWENGQVTIERVRHEEQNMLTTWYTEHAVSFIQRHKDEPFFLYVPHSMPHVPLHVSKKFKDKSGLGLYADVMMEVDWSVGEINRALKENGLEKNTMLIFTSDNGPWISYGNHAGKTPFREAKATSFDGGTRSACIIKYPGKIAAGVVSENVFCTIDILPTLCALAGVELPENEIDGVDAWKLMDGEDTTAVHDYYAFSKGGNFEAVISGDGRWKLHLAHEYRTLEYAGKDGMPGKYKQAQIGLSLFDMKNDPFEKTNVIDEHPQIAAKLQRLAKEHRERFFAKGDNK